MIARLLDEIVQAATQTKPTKRPTMEELATVLKKWL
jgi:hypothetical protein